MLAGGADAAIIPSGMGGFIACKALSQNNSSPEKASRPWDKNRDGFVMGEGAGLCSKGYCWIIVRMLRACRASSGSSHAHEDCINCSCPVCIIKSAEQLHQSARA